MYGVTPLVAVSRAEYFTLTIPAGKLVVVIVGGGLAAARIAGVDEIYRDEDKWTRMCVMNIANMGKFSSDRTILEYAKDVWNLKPCPIQIPNAHGPQ